LIRIASGAIGVADGVHKLNQQLNGDGVKPQGGGFPEGLSISGAVFKGDADSKENPIEQRWGKFQSDSERFDDNKKGAQELQDFLSKFSQKDPVDQERMLDEFNKSATDAKVHERAADPNAIKYASAAEVIGSRNASEVQKMDKVREAAQRGQKEIKIGDQSFEPVMKNMGHGHQTVHLFDKDGNIVLRAMAEHKTDGWHYSHERDKRGHDVPMSGDRFSHSHPDSSVIKFGDSYNQSTPTGGKAVNNLDAPGKPASADHVRPPHVNEPATSTEAPNRFKVLSRGISAPSVNDGPVARDSSAPLAKNKPVIDATDQAKRDGVESGTVETSPFADKSRVLDSVPAERTTYNTKHGINGGPRSSPLPGLKNGLPLGDKTAEQFVLNPVKTGFVAAAASREFMDRGRLFRTPENEAKIIQQVAHMTAEEWHQKWDKAYAETHHRELSGIMYAAIDTGGAIQDRGRIDVLTERNSKLDLNTHDRHHNRIDQATVQVLNDKLNFADFGGKDTRAEPYPGLDRESPPSSEQRTRSLSPSTRDGRAAGDGMNSTQQQSVSLPEGPPALRRTDIDRETPPAAEIQSTQDGKNLDKPTEYDSTHRPPAEYLAGKNVKDSLPELERIYGKDIAENYQHWSEWSHGQATFVGINHNNRIPKDTNPKTMLHNTRAFEKHPEDWTLFHNIPQALPTKEGAQALMAAKNDAEKLGGFHFDPGEYNLFLRTDREQTSAALNSPVHARIGHSQHGRSGAVDLVGERVKQQEVVNGQLKEVERKIGGWDTKGMISLMTDHGFKWLGPKDRPHFTYVGATSETTASSRHSRRRRADLGIDTDIT
jgi:hypothetical protein